MSQILDPSSGNFTLISATGPTSTAYSPSTQADYLGDGDIDDYALALNDGSAFDESTGFMDSGASNPQIVQFDVLFKSMDTGGNARCYVGSVTDTETNGAKNAGTGYYIEHSGPNNANDVGIKFGDISGGNKYTFGNDLVLNTQYYYKVTYDPSADTTQLDIYTDASHTSLFESSGALDSSAGPDSMGGGNPVFQAIDCAPRGKGGAPYEVLISNVRLNQSSGGSGGGSSVESEQEKKKDHNDGEQVSKIGRMLGRHA